MLLGSFCVVMMTLGGLTSRSTLKNPKRRKPKIGSRRLVPPQGGKIIRDRRPRLSAGIRPEPASLAFLTWYMTTRSDAQHLDTAKWPFLDAKRSGRAGPSGRQARNLPDARYSHHSSLRARHELKFVLGASALVRTTWPCRWAAPPAPPAPAAGDRRRAYIRLQKACTPPRRENHKGPASSPIGRNTS